MNLYLSADVGGTKTLLRLDAAEGMLRQNAFSSVAYAGLDEMVAEFLQEACAGEISSACFALAGPVAGRQVRLTNLPWEVDADALARRFNIPRVALINDFQAVGHGIAALPSDELLTLQAGQPEPGNRLVLGAGTGLGVAWLTPAHGRYKVHPSEGGHIDFAPTDDTQHALLRYLQQRHGHVSYERIVSGPGLVAIFEFLRDSGRAQPSPQLLAAMAAGDAAAALTQSAQQGDEPIAQRTLALFIDVYGAFAGNLALAALPRGGVYVAGGIAAKIAHAMQQGGFLHAFLDKGRFGALLQTLPLHIVLNEEVGLLGAAAYARKGE
ncbi:MAG TPA: glucokinase [Gallionellaceae bacterium]|nr:glucokinase [Gallionellaceae bacterium]